MDNKFKKVKFEQCPCGTTFNVPKCLSLLVHQKSLQLLVINKVN
uniref:Uncharacterized protein n=1 Tax=Rhizophora mucronata TaxID=61149 RepID=A0A2P2PWU4_RHIMU